MINFYKAVEAKNSDGRHAKTQDTREFALLEVKCWTGWMSLSLGTPNHFTHLLQQVHPNANNQNFTDSPKPCRLTHPYRLTASKGWHRHNTKQDLKTENTIHRTLCSGLTCFGATKPTHEAHNP